MCEGYKNEISLISFFLVLFSRLLNNMLHTRFLSSDQTFRVNTLFKKRKMCNKLFEYFIIFLAIPNLSAFEIKSLNCCDILEIVFMQKCNELERFNLEHIKKTLSFKCIRSNIENRKLNQIIIQFDAAFVPKNNNDLANCRQQLNSTNHSNYSQIIYTLEICNLQVHSITIHTNASMELFHFNALARQVPNITELRWQIHEKCLPVNEIIVQFTHLKSLTLEVDSSVDLKKCRDYNSIGSQLQRLYINLNQTYEVKSVNLTKLLPDMKRLNELKLNCGSKVFEISLNREVFQDMSHLEELALMNCRIVNLSAAHFHDLTSLKVLNLSSSQFDNFDWLRYVCSALYSFMIC